MNNPNIPNNVVPMEPWRERRDKIARDLAAVSILRVEEEQDLGGLATPEEAQNE